MRRLDFREEFERRRREPRWVAAALGLLLVVLTVLYYLIQRGRDLPQTLVTNQVLLFVLRNLNALLILVILFVLARNLFKLWLERRSRVLGARFKTKLVATYVGLSLVPVLVLFFYASELLQGSIDRWFSASAARLLQGSAQVAQKLQEEIARRDGNDARRLARSIQDEDLGETARRAALQRRLRLWRDETGADFVALYEGTESADFVHAVVDPSAGMVDLPEVPRPFLLSAAESGRAVRILAPRGGRGRLILSAAASPGPPGARRALVVVGTLLDPATAVTSEELIQSYQSYRQLEVQKGAFRASYLLMFVLVTLLILLASSWMGLYLARRLMTPIQALAEGTRRVSEGDLEHRVAVSADDEMAAVVDSFNRMTEELGRSRRLIEENQRDLVRANRTLEGERALIGAILESLAAGVLALDAGGRVLAANGAAQRMLRQREEELVGRPLAEAWSDPERARLGAQLDAPAGGPPTQVSAVIAGERRTFEVKVTSLPAGDGGPAGRLLVLEDLSELVRAQKLAAWTEAARRIAHEIKNPLTPIRLAAERLRVRQRQETARAGGEEPSPVMGELVEESVDTIVGAVGTLSNLVDEFSRYARMPGPQLAPTRVDRLLAEVVALYRGVKPGVEVRGESAAEIGAPWVDPEQLRRVLINLIDNAVEATDAPGEIVVAAARRGESVALSVADSGRGIPPEDRDKLFLPFFSRKGRGTGMGLAIVQRIVSEHAGSIRVEENRPRGSVFVVELPAGGGAERDAAGRGE
jgi:two-component system nitrogen regulation sensor histidine kinase NtrY